MLQSYFIKEGIEAGVDEAGRGCLAGPVVAAAVILPSEYHHPFLNDSKKVTEQHREILKFDIFEKALAYGIGIVSPKEIDQINILQASFLAMHKAIQKLSIPPDRLLVDGHLFKPYHGINHHCMIKGDARFRSIAAASILAKTYRDELMKNLSEEYSQYGWKTNKGYPTVEHRNAILKWGFTPHHRRSFKVQP
jgi:ribonuclease HII